MGKTLVFSHSIANRNSPYSSAFSSNTYLGELIAGAIYFQFTYYRDPHIRIIIEK